MSSSSYPVLDNKPIDQWKVTELKEELKRRKLKSSGKKEELIRMLGNAIRIEREQAAKEEEVEANNDADSVSEPVVGVKDAKKLPNDTGIAKDVVIVGSQEKEKVDNVAVHLDMNTSAAALDQGEIESIEIAGNINENDAALEQEKILERDITGDTNPARVEEELVIHKTIVETSKTVTENVVTELALSGQELHNSGALKENLYSSVRLEISKPQLEDESVKPLRKDDMLDTSAPVNQVSEVSANLGSQIKSDSISTDSVSINEKIELKDNIIADNVKLEQDVIRPEMVEPSSTNIVPVGGESHPMDVEEPLERKTSIEETDYKNATIADMGKKNDSANVGYSEKLNLDRSSGEDSIEEDVLESNKQIDSKDSSDELRDRSEKDEVPAVKVDSPVDVIGDGLSDGKKVVQVEGKSCPAVVAEKRKINDQEAVGSNEPLKRQRKWNSESLKLTDQSSNLIPTTTPRDTFQSSASKRNLSRSDSVVSDDTAKERVVPPSPKSPTNSLRVDHFVRPFTLKAVHELLGKTGSFTCFWMDHIKTHCYVTYSSVDEAMETRKALYNIQWPPNNGGRPLVAEFVDPQEVKMRAEAPPQLSATPVSVPPPAPPALQPQPSTHQPAPRQQLAPPPPVSNSAPARERFTLPLPPPTPEKVDPPIMTLDDLFRKTKATPCIYYLPLSEGQVVGKLQSRRNNTKQSAGVNYRKELFQPSLGIWFVNGFRFGFSKDSACLRHMLLLVLEPSSSPNKTESLTGVLCLVFLLNWNSNFYRLVIILLDYFSFYYWMRSSISDRVWSSLYILLQLVFS
ncbi:apoptotic chromatin condensation inducer in the nucleus-like isoform X2 [Mangifera indica]|nr:apoptotic chromatin condensation inducer in the nucleus-like isoform X2 [Mangifera indica]XP_044501262.1 apoptotic chromatin condensation inducer in the nucleus-like isoform X2 [Mangifera indica]XP_044501270.1 apoptotic chromatin condensation inducer in the nucleus-like isoform X2 [Mangifera indica]XP_044501278.1 apoptotic chromatin condensation inducer in the nucleus-like isoform X2 [Mangifera indica]XP_044501285.1 apoptotic chromatin condensation inducer in the nucleus-like isoform X2 [Man